MLGDGDKCVFCEILSRNTDNVVLRTDDLAILQDIRPASDHHYLVIPVQHIKSVSSLKAASRDHHLVSRMNDLARNFIKQQTSASITQLVSG